MDNKLRRIVGERVKRLRMQSGVSLREQSRTLGISASSLSDLENGHGGISLSRLQVVARHFDLSITDLLSDESQRSKGRSQETVEVFRRRDDGHSRVRRGTGTIYQLLGSGRGHELQPAVLTFEPGGGYERDRIGHVGEEFAFVVLGDVELLHGDHTYVLGPGDSVRFWASPPHAYRNASQSDVAFMITVATPPW
jgi:transcriptional regulator with XRE-family HTH domain